MFNSLINLFFPPVCFGCKRILISNERSICTFCRHDMPLTYHHLNHENEAFKKFYGRVPVAYASTLLYFHKKGIVQEIIHHLKYHGHQEIGTLLGKWYGEELKTVKILKTVDAIIPVPLHKKKFKQRGYNQLTLFGEALSEELKIDFNPHILFRKVYSKTQSKKNFGARIEVIDTLFDVVFTEKDCHKHFLLIDDVLTTGATLEACAKALLKIPGTKISMVCMAMTT